MTPPSAPKYSAPRSPSVTIKPCSEKMRISAWQASTISALSIALVPGLVWVYQLNKSFSSSSLTLTMSARCSDS